MRYHPLRPPQESLVAPILAEGAAERRQLRPLMDAILTVKRQL